ncbi:MAG: OmpA family protein [Methylococcales bacterium]|nr:OmpA family protein [Methylococcales bacterium]
MLRKHVLALVALTSINFLSMAQAEEVVDDRWYVAPFGTFVQPGGDRVSNNGFGGGMGFGKMIDEHFNVELKGFYQGLSGDNGNGSWSLTGGTADVQYFIDRDTFSPYTVLGLGAMNSSHNSGSGTGFIGEAGAGATYEVSDNFLVRGDVRYRYNQNFNANLQPGTNEFHDMVINLGFVIPFGPKPQPVVAEAPPAPLPVAEGCATKDDDNDGVNNCVDKCPNTLPGAKVSVAGCWIVDVKFANDSAVIPPEYFANLDNTAKMIKENPGMPIEIQGHTSKTGGFKYNMKLSERRAMAVKQYLVDGYDFPNLTTKGYGWTQPIDTNDTEEGRANNRRVQLQVLDEPQPPMNPQEYPAITPQP